MHLTPLYFVGILAFVAIVIFVRIFWSVMRWEIAFDMRIFSFGFHTFLLGMVATVGLLGWFGFIPALTQIFH
jgi:hypothetical protein